MKDMELYFTRHAESLENIGEEIVDSPLSARGRRQAAMLSGFYDTVVVSPMRRCLETLHYSKITYSNLEICPSFRERRRYPGSEMLLELPVEETMDQFRERIERFDKWFRELLQTYNYKEEDDVLRVLLIGHGLFFHLWNKSDGPDMPNNAEIFRLDNAEADYNVH